ncbi:MAG: hypothetical protein SFV24_17315 [Gemmatimonadales bacterium]|nr:hypothetical protein [Gemmatimonadales bacterium]
MAPVGLRSHRRTRVTSAMRTHTGYLWFTTTHRQELIDMPARPNG